MSYIYELIGRFVVQAVWWRFGRQIQIGGCRSAVPGRSGRLPLEPEGSAGRLSRLSATAGKCKNPPRLCRADQQFVSNR